MQASSVNDFLSNPLAGCDPVIQEPGNFNTMKGSLSMRLALFYTRAIAAEVVSEIEVESGFRITHKHEYCINELLFEIRKAAKNLLPEYGEEYESGILNDWAKILLKRHETDKVLDFINQVKDSRMNRNIY